MEEAADVTAKEIVVTGGTAMGVAMDVSDEQAVNDGVEAVVAEFGGVDILVSNAGISVRGSARNRRMPSLCGRIVLEWVTGKKGGRKSPTDEISKGWL